jgi:hypothetical protein
VRMGLMITIVGLFVYVLGVQPQLFNLDKAEMIGFVQIAVLLVGLAMICLGGFVSINSLWNSMQKTIAADIGYRLVATGYVIAVTSGMADVFGFGNQIYPAIPYFGPLQAIGLMVGLITISLGFILVIPYKLD